MTDQYAIVHQVEELDSEQVKAFILNWLLETSGSLSDFERLLSRESHHQVALEYGQLDEALSFQQMTDAEMTESSLQVLAEYERTHKGISHERVRDWLDAYKDDRL